MKTLVLTSFALLLSISMFARDDKNSKNYIVTKSDTIVCKNVVDQQNIVRVDFQDLRFVEMNKDDVFSYIANGKKYDRLPLYKNNKPTGKTALMEMVKDNNGFKLYKYTNNGETSMFVYKDNKYYVGITDANKANMLDFFQVKE